MVFDNISNVLNSVPGALGGTTSSIPNTYMGDGYVLADGTTSITGVDLYPDNQSGTTFTGLKINFSIWGTVNTSGTVNSITPAFSNLLGSYTFTSSGNYTSGFFYPFQLTLATPLSITNILIGVSANYQGTTDGVNYTSVNGLTSLISYGATNTPTVGSNQFNAYYRNANSESDGNFTSTLRSFGQQNQSVALRVYGVPEPSTLPLLGLAGLALLILSHRKTAK